MARQRRLTPAVGGTLVLDADGVTKAAANDPRVQAFLTSARNRDARVVVSAITLAEVVRCLRRDVGIHRVLSRVSQVPVTTTIARTAGELLGAARLDDATIDAVVAATAMSEPRPVVILTSERDDLGRLTSWERSIAVRKV